MKRAPILLVSALAGALLERRRYTCADCHWTGWKHRLQRRSEAVGVSLQPRRQPEPRALGFFLGAVIFLLVTTLLLVRNCESSPFETPAIPLNR